MDCYCPKCNNKMFVYEVNYKPIKMECKCGYKPNKKEMEEIYDCCIIEEDMEIWKKVKGIK